MKTAVYLPTRHHDGISAVSTAIDGDMEGQSMIHLPNPHHFSVGFGGQQLQDAEDAGLFMHEVFVLRSLAPSASGFQWRI